MEIQSFRKNGKGRQKMREAEDLNFNPEVTEFTDICTRIRLAVPHSYSGATLSFQFLRLILPTSTEE